MRYSSQNALALALLLPLSLAGQGQVAPPANASTLPTVPRDPSPVSKIDTGPNHNVWGHVQQITNPITQAVRTTTNVAYTEMATGLNYQDANGQWVEASEEIDITADGGQAVHGQATASFLQNVNSGLTHYTTPDGKNLNFHVLGLSYQDASGKSVLFAQLKDSSGMLLPSKSRVLYSNTFEGTLASLRYSYTRSGFEQDVILNGALPDSRDWGLDPHTVMLQIFTEFVDSAEPGDHAPAIEGWQFRPASQFRPRPD